MESEIVSDGVLAQDQTQIAELWSWREGITECLGHDGGVYKYDLSIPIAELYDLVNETRDRLTEAGLVGTDDSHPVVDVVGYGHMGDANLHLNIPVRRFDKTVEKALEPWVYEWVQKRNGSISAEHGLGVTKKPYIGYSKSETMVRLMKQIKDLYDPVSCVLSLISIIINGLVERYHEPVQVHLGGVAAILLLKIPLLFLDPDQDFIVHLTSCYASNAVQIRLLTKAVELIVPMRHQIPGADRVAPHAPRTEPCPHFSETTYCITGSHASWFLIPPSLPHPSVSS